MDYLISLWVFILSLEISIESDSGAGHTHRAQPACQSTAAVVDCG